MGSNITCYGWFSLSEIFYHQKIPQETRRKTSTKINGSRYHYYLDIHYFLRILFGYGDCLCFCKQTPHRT